MLMISDIVVRQFKGDDDKLLGFASITISRCFIVKDLKIIRGKQGRFVAMPSRRGKDGIFHDVCHPLNQTVRDQIEKQVLDAYSKAESEGFPDAVATN